MRAHSKHIHCFSKQQVFARISQNYEMHTLSLSVCLWSFSHLRIEWNAKIQIQIFLFLSSRKCFDGKWLEASVVMLLITMHRIKIILKVNTSNYRVYEFFMFFFFCVNPFFTVHKSPIIVNTKRGLNNGSKNHHSYDEPWSWWKSKSKVVFSMLLHPDSTSWIWWDRHRECCCCHLNAVTDHRTTCNHNGYEINAFFGNMVQFQHMTYSTSQLK